MKHRVWVLVLFAGLAASAVGAFYLVAGRQDGADGIRVSIFYTQPYPVLNDAIAGFKEVLLAKYPDARFTERHANGRPEEYNGVVLAAINDRPDLLVPMTTAITSLAVKEARGILPVVFIAVTDPVGAGVADSIDHPRLSTGASDLCPYSSLLATIRDVIPNARAVGLPYNPTDQPAVYGRAQIRALAARYGLTVVDAQFSGASELSTVVQGVASRSDVIVIGSDNLMMENAAQVASTARSEGKPTVSCDSASVRAGAVAGVNIDYREVGRLAGQRAVQILEGARPGELPIAVLNSGGLAINRRSACILHISIPSKLYSSASEIADRDYKCNP